MKTFFCLLFIAISFTALSQEKPITSKLYYEKDLDSKLQNLWQWMQTFNLDSLSRNYKTIPSYKYDTLNFELKTTKLMGLTGTVKVRFIKSNGWDGKPDDFYSYEYSYYFSFTDLDKDEKKAQEIYKLIKESLIRIGAGTLTPSKEKEEKSSVAGQAPNLSMTFTDDKRKSTVFYLSLENGKYPGVSLRSKAYKKTRE